MSKARTVSQIKQRWIALKGSDIAEDPWIYVSDVADMLNHYDALKAENARLRATLEARIKRLRVALAEIVAIDEYAYYDKAARMVDNAREALENDDAERRIALNADSAG